MKKNSLREPELFIDDNRGVYMMQQAWQQLAERYKQQARKKLDAEAIASIEAGPNDELHFECCDELTQVEFRTETGQRWSLEYAEGGIWAIPACFRRTKAANEFFGN